MQHRFRSFVLFMTVLLIAGLLLPVQPSSAQPTPIVMLSTGPLMLNEGNTGTVMLTRTGDVSAALTVNLNIDITSFPGTTTGDYTLTGGSLSAQSGIVTAQFPAGDASVPISVAITVDGDSAEPENRVIISINTGTDYTVGSPSNINIIIPTNGFLVTVTDNAGEGSFRQALLNAEELPGANTITFAASANGTITIISPVTFIRSSVTVTGNGAANTIISGGNFGPLLRINGTASNFPVVVFNDLTVTNAGTASSNIGGAIFNRIGNLTLNNVVLTGNRAARGAGIYNESPLTINSSEIHSNTGQGVYSTGSVTMNNSVIRNNTLIGLENYGLITVTSSRLTSNGGFGLFHANSTSSVRNSLLTGNTGGGLNMDSGDLTLVNTTLSGNGAVGIQQIGGTLNINNSISASHTNNCNRTGGTLNASNSLLQGAVSCINGTINVNNLSGDPLLNATTFVPGTGSPAIDAGDNALIPSGINNDLAGNARIQGARVDMGAFETEPPPPPEVSISATDAAGAEAGPDALMFTITRTGATTSALTVTYTVGGTADSADYTPTLTGTIEIPASAVSADLVVTPVDDAIDETDETVIITLADTVGYDLGTASAATGTITDNDTAGVVVSESGSSTSITEGGSLDTFFVVLESQPSADVTVNLAFDAAQLALISGGNPVSSLTFTPTNWNVAQDVTVTAVDDSVIEANPYTSVITTTTTSTDTVYSAINPADVTVSITENDTATVSFSAPSGTIAEDLNVTSSGIVLNLVANGTPGGTLGSAVTIPLTLTLGTAESGDLSLDTPSVTFAVGSLDDAGQNFDFTPTLDRLLESSETATVSFGTVTGPVTTSGTFTLTITDNETAAIMFDSTTSSAPEGTTPHSVGVTLTVAAVGDTGTAGIEDAVSVVVTDTAGTALTPNDYSLPTGTTVTFAAGSVSPVTSTVSPTIGDDSVVEVNETFGLGFGTVTSASTNAVSASGTHTVTISDNDGVAAISVSAVTGAAAEETVPGPVTASFTVATDTTPTETVMINVLTDGQCTVSPNPIELPAGSITPVTVTVSAVNDTVVEAGTHPCAITLESSSSSDPVYNGIIFSPVSVDIFENDITYIVTTSVSPVSEGTGTNTVITFTITPGLLSVLGDIGGTVTYTLTDPTGTTTSADFSTPLAGGTLTFPQITAETVSVTVIGDSIAEPNFQLVLTITAASIGSGGTAYTVGSPAIVTVTDDDIAGVGLGFPNGLPLVSESGTTDTFDVQLNAQPASDVVMSVTSGDTSEATVSPNTLTFTPANWNIAQTVTVTGVDDDLADSDQLLAVTLSVDAVLSDNAFDSLRAIPIEVTNLDNDTAGVTVTQTDGTTDVTEGGATDSLDVRLNTQPTADVTVTLTPDAQTTLITTTLTFTPATWNIPQPVTVTAVDDSAVEGSHTGMITVSVGSGDAGYNAFAVQPVTVNVTDNDSTPVSTITPDPNISPVPPITPVPSITPEPAPVITVLPPLPAPSCPLASIPPGSVVGRLSAIAQLYYEPGLASPGLFLPGGTAWWVTGLDSTGEYYQIIIACQRMWVEADLMGANFDSPWFGFPLPTTSIGG